MPLKGVVFVVSIVPTRCRLRVVLLRAPAIECIGTGERKKQVSTTRLLLISTAARSSRGEKP